MKFTAKDFLFGNVYGDGARLVAEKSAEIANVLLKKWLSEAPVLEHKCRTVYYCSHHDWYTSPRSKPTHRARLVCIEPLHQNQTPLKSD